MAKRRLAFIIAIAIPLLALLSHQELRRILLWDILIIARLNPTAALEMLPKPADPLYRAIREAEGSPDLSETFPREAWRPRWLAYERLYRQTGQVWLGVFGLRYAMDAVPLGRTEHQEPPSPQPLRRPSPEEVRRLLALANELSERDKDNAFPLLVKAYALFALQRDVEAFRTLQEAAQRPTYRTYEDAWLRVTAPKGLTVEERVIGSASLLLPHLSSIRELARLVVWHAAEAEVRGDYAEALQRTEALLKVASMMREHAVFLIEPLVGIAIQHMAFAGRTRRLTDYERERLQREVRLQRVAERFAAFARRHGRPDLAEWALKEAEAAVTVYEIGRSLSKQEMLFPGFSQRDSRRLTNARLSGFVLLASIVLLMLVTLITTLFLWRTGRAIDRYAPFTAAFLAAGLPIAAIVWGIVGAIGVEFWEFWNIDAVLERVLWLLLVPFATLGLLFVVCFLPALWRLRRVADWRTFVILLGAVALLTLLVIAGFGAPKLGTLVNPLIAALLLCVIVGTVAALTWLKQQLDSPSLQVRILSAVALAIMSVLLVYAALWFLASLELSPQAFAMETFAVVVVILLTAFALVFLLAFSVWARWGQEEKRLICQGVLWRLRDAALLLVLLCWWGYGIVSVSSLPLRHRLHQALDEVIAHGELIAWQKVLSGSPDKR